MKNPYFNPAKRHHRPDGFQNNYQSFRGKRLGELLRWRWQAWRAGHPQPLREPIPVVAPAAPVDVPAPVKPGAELEAEGPAQPALPAVNLTRS